MKESHVLRFTFHLVTNIFRRTHSFTFYLFRSTIPAMQTQMVLNGRYQLLERIGSGGMAVVYKAQDTALGRIVAIKMLHESLTSDEGFLHRFQHEAHAVANLTHPNIVTVHDIGQDGNRHYMVMEYVEGRTLKHMIREQTGLGRFMPVGRALDLIIQICNGIGYAHRAELVHCDVKPQNVLVTHDDRVKVADFGIARAISQSSVPSSDEVWGTPHYFAPEQALGEPATPASDVYAIGVILFEMLTGRLPFEGESAKALAMKHIRETPPPITKYNPAIPSQIEQIVAKVLAKEAAGRYRTAGQLGRILGTYREKSLQETGTMRVTPMPVSEQKTQIHQRPERPLLDTSDNTPKRPMRPLPASTKETALPASAQDDWVALSLGIAALTALLGLVPLWYFVYRAWVG